MRQKARHIARYVIPTPFTIHRQMVSFASCILMRGRQVSATSQMNVLHNHIVML